MNQGYLGTEYTEKSFVQTLQIKYNATRLHCNAWAPKFGPWCLCFVKFPLFIIIMSLVYLPNVQKYRIVLFISKDFTNIHCWRNSENRESRVLKFIVPLFKDAYTKYMQENTLEILEKKLKMFKGKRTTDDARQWKKKYQ